MSLKEKAISGFLWSFIDSFANQGIQFIVGIVLARILSPVEFGLVGMLTVFIAISQTFIDSGFTSALIRKKECTQEDYSTVFYFNLTASIFLYCILFLSSDLIGLFFNEPQLKYLLQVLGFGLIINSFGIIQRTILTKTINFKLQTKISIVSSVGSGIIAIAMALLGFGVWSLIVLTLSRFFLSSLFLTIWQKWKPLWVFKKDSFKELFSFGGNLLLSGLIDTLFRNIYLLIIGKYFSAIELGYYTRADQFRALPSQNMTSIIMRVSYPLLSEMQDNQLKLKDIYRKLIRSTMLLTFLLMLGLAAIAEPMVLLSIGPKWLPSVVYLQMLCFVGISYPLNALNLNMLQVQGRSDLFLKLEVIKKILAIPTIIVGVFFGIKIMIVGMMINTLISYYINSYWSGLLIKYSIYDQIRDISPSLFLAFIVSSCVYSIGLYFKDTSWLILISQILMGFVITILLSEILKIKDYLFLKKICVEQIMRQNNK